MRLRTLSALILSAWTPLASFAAAAGPEGDTDLDGVGDLGDAFPCDWRRTAVAFVPGEFDYATLLFEDNWPAKGDLDFNDAVLLHHYAVFYDASGLVTGLRVNLLPRALGASIVSGLGLRLPVPASALASIERRVGGGSPTTLTALVDETNVVIPLVSSTRDLFNGAVGFLNTSVDRSPMGDGDRVTVELTFQYPVSLDLGSDPFDLYFYRTADPTHQIHRPQFSGTDTMRTELFGTADDGSTAQRAFVDRDGLPFVLSIPAQSVWPLEQVRVEQLWPDLTEFASSAGASAADFYVSNVNPTSAYPSAPSGGVPGLDFSSCVAPSCTDGARNGSETDVDCGGGCPACSLGSSCRVHDDCARSVCRASACVDDDERTCTLDHGSGAQGRVSGGWAACQATACETSFHVEGGACLGDVRACAIANGTGSQTWTGSTYGACDVVSCNNGYRASNGACLLLDIVASLDIGGGPDFGTVSLGQSASRTVTLTNTGAGTAIGVYLELAVTGMTFAGNTCGTAGARINLGPGASCTATLTFAPSSVGARSGTLTAHGNWDSGPVTTTLTGTGSAAIVALSSASGDFDFGAVTLNSVVSRTFTLTNSGNVAATGVSVAIAGAALTVTSNGCGESGATVALAPGATCDFTVQYAPTTISSLTGASVAVTGGFQGGTLSRALTGSGRGAIGQVTAAGGFDFTSVVQFTSASRTITVQNTGNVPATGVYVTASGTSVTLESNTCGTAAAPTTLAANASCTAVVTYAPTVAGPMTGGHFTAFGSFTNGSVSHALSGSCASATVYATWDPASVGTPFTTQLTNNNLTVSQSRSGMQFAYANISKSSGRWYWEVTVNSATSNPAVTGVSSSLVTRANATTANCWGCGGATRGYWGFYATTRTGPGVFGTPSTSTYTGVATGLANAAGTVYGFALDADLGTLSIYTNCTYRGVFGALNNPPWKPQIGSGGNSALPNLTANFGATAFTCTVPSGYNAGLF